MQDFHPHWLLRRPHRMTLAAAFWPRRFPGLPRPVERAFETEPGTCVLAHCHWQAEPQRHPTLALLHGLEGSSQSGYVLGTAEKAFAAGFNVLRVNQRSCGGSDDLTPTLYNSSLSGDIRAVLLELIACDGLPEIFAAGFSMGGNLVLKMAGELADTAPKQLRAVIAVSPSLDVAACADALGQLRNRIYQRHFVGRLKRHMWRRIALYPDRYHVNGLLRIRTIRQFDNDVTARYCGFRDADDYYAQASALRVVARIRVPTLILAAQDDPLIPFQSFLAPAIRENRSIELLAPRNGGHCGFVTNAAGKNRFSAESCIVEFCQRHTEFHDS